MRTIFSLLFALLAMQGFSAPLQVSSFFDWQTGKLQITMTAVINNQEMNAPVWLYNAQQRIEREFPQLLFAHLLFLQLDSQQSIEEAVRNNPQLAAHITKLTVDTHKSIPIPSLDMKTVTQQYEIPIFPDLASFFINHSIAFRMESTVFWQPTQQFSGIVIYAAEPMQLHGTNKKVLLQPALLPEIYDENLLPVLEQDMTDPRAVRRWGVVAYTESTSEDAWQNRIGAFPMRIIAEKAYGITPTDIIIKNKDARRLLSLQHNRALLNQGRILVILAPGQTIVQDSVHIVVE